MLVLIDLEWVEISKTSLYPTQLAAIRVNADWEIVDQVHYLMRPEQIVSFIDWSHMAFAGKSSEQYLNADQANACFQAFDRWLKPDDQCYFWQEDPASTYYSMHKRYIGWGVGRSIKAIRDAIVNQLTDGHIIKGNPYILCADRGIDVLMPAHDSLNDVEAIRLLARSLQMDQEKIFNFRRKDTKKTGIGGKYQPFTLNSSFPYFYDPSEQIVHKRCCEQLIVGRPYQGFNTLGKMIKDQILPCSCCREDYNKACRSARQQIAETSQYNYIYLQQSKVFHKTTCHLVLNSVHGSLLGAINFDTAIASGRQPCKICKPKVDDVKKIRHHVQQQASSYSSMVHLDSGVTRDLSRNELNAYKRHKEAVRDRQILLSKKGLSQQEYADGMTLSQPGYAFWAARGYSNFHRRECPKLKGLQELKGFAMYGDAVSCGLTPCKICKPSKKNQAVLSIPITSREKRNETTETLKNLCQRAGFSFAYEAPMFMFETPVGKWRLDITNRPVVLEHINTAMTPEKEFYHEQPRRFLSLTDAFQYVERHDRHIMENGPFLGKRYEA